MAAKVARFFENAKIVIHFSNFKELCKINASFAEGKNESHSSLARKKHKIYFWYITLKDLKEL